MKRIIKILLFINGFLLSVVAGTSVVKAVIDYPESKSVYTPLFVFSCIVFISAFYGIVITLGLKKAFESEPKDGGDYKSHSIGYMPTDKLDTTNPPKSRDRLYLELSDCDGMCKFCNPDLKFKCETLKNQHHGTI